jgi:diketogulonate reductase-like aldo/keto reductase
VARAAGHRRHPEVEVPERIRANADVAGFSLTDDDVASLDGLGG